MAKAWMWKPVGIAWKGKQQCAASACPPTPRASARRSSGRSAELGLDYDKAAFRLRWGHPVIGTL